MNLLPVLKKYRGIIITKSENVRRVSDILHSDPDICYMSGADVHEYDDINIRALARNPDRPVVMSFCWYLDEGVRLTCSAYINEGEKQYYITDVELIERFSKSIIILNEVKEA